MFPQSVADDEWSEHFRVRYYHDGFGLHHQVHELVALALGESREVVEQKGLALALADRRLVVEHRSLLADEDAQLWDHG